MTKNINFQKLFFILLLLTSFMIFFRDAFYTIEYFMIHKSIPFYRLENLETKGIILYFRDLSMLIWNFVWTYYFLVKKKKRLVATVLFAYILLLVFYTLININEFNINLMISDIRIISGIHMVIGILFVVKYYVLLKTEIPIYKVMIFLVLLAIVNATVSLIQFYIVGGFLGSRVMGLFSNAALSSYILLMAEVLVILLFKHHYKGKLFFIIVSVLFFIAILTTGTRVSMVGYLLVMSLFMIIPFLRNKNQNLSIFFLLMLSLVFIPFFLYTVEIANTLAVRGDMLNQDQSGRITVLKSIIETLSNHGLFRILFGEGIGWGSNVGSTLATNIPDAYKVADGTIQFLLIHSGILGIFILFYLFYLLYNYLRNSKMMFLNIMLPVVLIGLSTNIFEVYAVLFIMGISIAFEYQQTYNTVKIDR